MGLPQWVAGVLPLCQNLTALHLKYVEVKELPALPLLMHVILHSYKFTPLLVASIRGLTRLETLWVCGLWDNESSAWDMRACTRLRRLFMGPALAADMADMGQALSVPPACAVALDSREMDEGLPWLMQLSERLADLRFHCLSLDDAALHISYLHAPQLSQLRHLTMCLSKGVDAGSLCVAHLLGGLPQSVESLHLEYPILWSEQAVVVVPANLRALRVKGVCDKSPCRYLCHCDPSQRSQDLTFGLHAGLERLCLLLWEARVGLQCLDAGAPAGLRELNVQAREVDMDALLCAEIARRGRVLNRFDVLDKWWDCTRTARGRRIVSASPALQVVYIGRGPVHLEGRCLDGRKRLWHWACTCGACAECLGPQAFGGVAEAWC